MAQAAQPEIGYCRLFPQAIEGPYYFDPELLRSDITEGRPGVPVVLSLRVIEMGPCTGIKGARVDLWHADALGTYSGYTRQGPGRDVSTIGQKFLRGTQVTDADGVVTFRTIYPGWYPGRTPHMHVKVFLDTTTLLTGQLYLADDLTARIYAGNAAYASRSRPDTSNAQDGIFRDGERAGGGLVMTAVEADGLVRASLVIAVDRAGDAARHGGGWLGGIRRTLGR